jgi:hypothetical protein
MLGISGAKAVTFPDETSRSIEHDIKNLQKQISDLNQDRTSDIKTKQQRMRVLETQLQQAEVRLEQQKRAALAVPGSTTTTVKSVAPVAPAETGASIDLKA